MAEYEYLNTLDIYPGAAGQSGLPLWASVSNVTTRNELSYNAQPGRYNDMTLKNDEEAFYVPTVEFVLNALSRSDFESLMQIVNSKGFIVRYYDQELGERVYRSMYATESSIERLLHSAATFDGVNGCKVKFVSRYGYPYTMRSDSNYKAENKYHMYQLYAHKDRTNFLPEGKTMEEVEGYV